MSATNSIGRGKKNVSVTIPKEMDTELRRLAKASGMSRNEYCREILTRASENGTVLKQKTEHVATKPATSASGSTTTHHRHQDSAQSAR